MPPGDREALRLAAMDAEEVADAVRGRGVLLGRDGPVRAAFFEQTGQVASRRPWRQKVGTGPV